MVDEPQVFEVFRRDREGAPMAHAGSITAGSPDLALLYAREVYGRRGESSMIWVAPRDAFQVVDDPDILRPGIDRSYRLVEGYRMRDKLQAVRQRLERTQRNEA